MLKKELSQEKGEGSTDSSFSLKSSDGKMKNSPPPFRGECMRGGYRTKATNKEQHCVGAYTPPPTPHHHPYLDVWLLVVTQDNINLRLNKLASEASFEDASLSSDCTFLHLPQT